MVRFSTTQTLATETATLAIEMDYAQLSLLTLLATLIASLYIWLKRNQSYWTQQNVPNISSPMFFLRRKKHLAYGIQDLYNRYKDSGNPFIGLFMLFLPTPLLLDLELIKNVFIADFDSFPDRGFYHNVEDDPLSANLLRLDGDDWKRLRMKLSPTFSSGKMKIMFPTVVDVAERFVAVMQEQLGELEIRDICARFTTDVIGSVAFGIECNSLREPHTEFRLKGDKAFGCYNPILDTLAMKMPKLFRGLHVKAFSEELITFYSKIVAENIEYREKNNIRRNDFLDLLIELKNTKVDGDFVLTLREIIGQAFIFFIGGFETSSTTMTYCLYELSKHQHIQQRARAEILDVLQRYDGELSYESLKEMRYLKQVLLETLRIYPVAPTLKRMTRKPYNVQNTAYTFEPGMQVIIPVYAIHHDPDYYPEPEKFEPDRFTAAEIQQRHPMTYLPFGAGPRACIAERFAKMETLIGLVMLLKNFRFSTTEKTPEFLDFDPNNLRIFSLKKSLHLKVEQI